MTRRWKLCTGAITDLNSGPDSRRLLIHAKSERTGHNGEIRRTTLLAACAGDSDHNIDRCEPLHRVARFIQNPENIVHSSNFSGNQLNALPSRPEPSILQAFRRRVVSIVSS